MTASQIDEPIRGYCMHCGASVPLWFPMGTDLEGDEEIELYEMWTRTKCEQCGETPNEAMRRI